MKMRWFAIAVIALSVMSVSCDQQKNAEEYIKSGQDFYDKTDWKSAIIELKNAIKLTPDNPKARALLGKAYLETFSSNAAIKELSRARDLGSDNYDVISALGKAYVQAREFKKVLEEIVKKDSYSPTQQANILALRANAYLAIDDRTAALGILNEARLLDENTIDVRLAWALLEKHNANVDAQRFWLKPLVEPNGGVADAWSHLGELENIAGNLEAAEKAYTRSIDIRQQPHIDYARRALVRVVIQDNDGAQADIDVLKKAGANWPMVGHIEGLIALQSDKRHKAQTHFQNVLSKVPQYAPSQYMLSLIYFNSRNYQNAVTLLEQYSAVNPDQVRPNALYANTLMRLNRVDEALIVLDRLIGKNPGDFRLLSLLGNAYLQQRQSKKAIEVLHKAIGLKPDEANSRLQLGAVLLSDQATFAQGQLQLVKALELDPDLLQAEFALFRSYIKEKRFEDARLLGQNLDKKVSEGSKGANMVALTYVAEGLPEKAEFHLKETLKRFPADFLTSHNLARLYMQDKKLADAKGLYEKVLVNEPSHLQSLNQLALIASREGDQEQLLLRLKQAEEGNPDQLSAKLALGSQYMRQSQANLAVQVLNKVKLEQQDLPGFVLLMAQAKLGVGEQQHAVRLLKLLIARNPNSPAAHFLMAQAYAIEKKGGEVRESLQKTLDLVPDHFGANIIMARLDLFEGEKEAFKKRVASLDKLYPDNVDILFLKAKVSVADNNLGEAVDTLSSIMDRWPNSSVAIDLSKNQWRAGDRNGAISVLELWVQGNADDSRAVMLLAQYYLEESRNIDARIAYQTLDSQTVNDPIALNNLAWLLKDIDANQGIKYALKALQLRPDTASIQDTLAMLYLETGENSKALDLSMQATTAMPSNIDFQINYARVLVANNQKEKARDLLNNLYIKSNAGEKKRLLRMELDNL